MDVQLSLITLPSLSLVLSAVALALTTYVAHFVLSRTLLAPLRFVPGPKRDNFILGNMRRFVGDRDWRAFEEWSDEFGGVVKYGGLYGSDRIVVTDPAALRFMLCEGVADFPKPIETFNHLIHGVFDDGLIMSQGNKHWRMRKVMNPAFYPTSLSLLMPTFFETAHNLRDKWTAAVEAGSLDLDAFKNEEARSQWEKTEGEAVIEAYAWMNKATLDIIGQAGLGYAFGAVDGKADDLAVLFSYILNSSNANAAEPALSAIVFGDLISRALVQFPVLKWFWKESFDWIEGVFVKMIEKSREILDAKKREIEEQGADSKSRDLIGLLLAAPKDPKAYLTDRELIGQMTTFVLAGHETTSTGLAWCLHHMALAPEKQVRVRREIRDARKKAAAEGRDELDMLELDGLPYLDMVTREALRIDPSIGHTYRETARPTVLPLHKPLRTPSGKYITSVPLPAGVRCSIPIRAVGNSKAAFGEDAGIFRPERWEDGSVKKDEADHGGIWGPMLTFTGGPRACIAYKFGILEMKAILSCIFDTFELAPRSDDMQWERRKVVTTQPCVVGELELGSRVPLRLRLAALDEE